MAGFTGHLNYPSGARLPAEDDVTPASHTHVLDGFPDAGSPNGEHGIAGLDFSAPEHDSCGESWSNFGLGDNLLQATGGPDINLAYFFTEHEW